MKCDDKGCTDPDCMGLYEAHKALKEQLKDDKWIVMGVAGETSVEGHNPTFAYTIGLHVKNLPELIIVGLDPIKATLILNNCAEKMITEGRIKHGTLIDDVANKPLTLINVSEEQKQDHAFQAFQAFNHYRHWDFELRQLVLPDPTGLFPWESDFDEGMRIIQPVLGNPPMEKMN